MCSAERSENYGLEQKAAWIPAPTLSMCVWRIEYVIKGYAENR